MPLSRLRGAGLVAVCALPLALTPSAPAAAAPPTAPPPSGPTASVTLVTGAKVTVTMTAEGATSPQVRDAKGRSIGFVSQRRGQDTYVFPYDALPYVSAGLLDRQLFNLTELVNDGYDDAHTDRLPLIVTYTDAAARSRMKSAPTGAEDVEVLDSIKGAAVRVARPADFWSSLTASSLKQAPGSPPVLSGGIAKVWLDGKSEETLTESTAQIGAPQVWATGNTGQGVDVAVLDTGIDATHPDLAGRIVATKSFAPGDPTVEDRRGHGTHVASTIAGTGAASGGAEKGVAPGVRLHIGKVITDHGSGENSDIIRGMEWAAREQHAKIINMSLGDNPTDGTDPMSMAVNQLSAETGALFVISVGNSGPYAFSVVTPGTADAALSIASVNSGDIVADTSGAGPRVGDRALKPDMSAPGVDILAARARYALDGEGLYQLMSGTSMATPHVAGAAALVAAKHPDLTGQQLKQILMNTVKPLPGSPMFRTGTGRLDAAAATATTVFATGNVSFGYPAWPTAPTTPVSREIRYTNIGDAAVTLDLSASGEGIPAGALALSAPKLTVPAHGSAAVALSVSFDKLPGDQDLAGLVTATTGSASVRTSFSVGREGQRNHLTVKVKDRGGKPVGGQLVLIGQGENPEYVEVGPTGQVDLRLPPATYTGWFTTDVEGSHGPSSRGFAIMPISATVLDRDRTVVLDGTKAKRITATTPERAEVTASDFKMERKLAGSILVGDWRPGDEYDSVWEVPSADAMPEFTFSWRWRLAQPKLSIDQYDDLRVRMSSTPLPDGPHHLDAVLEGDRDARGKAVVARRSDSATIADQAAAAAAAGARLLLVVNDGVGRLAPWPDSTPPPITVVTLTSDEGEKLIKRIQRERRVKLDVTSHPVAKYVYDLKTSFQGRMPADPTYRADRSNLARVDTSFRHWQPATVLEGRGVLNAAGNGTDTLTDSETPAQTDRVDWVTAGIPWVTQVRLGATYQEGIPTTYRAGTTVSEKWLSPVQRPRLLGWKNAVLRGPDGVFSATVAGWGDSGAPHMGDVYEGTEDTLSLYQGANLIARTGIYDTTITTSLPPERLPYRLLSENRRDPGTGPYSTSTRTEWGFTSAATRTDKSEAPALIQLDYAVDTDETGKARRHTDLTVIPVILPEAVEAGVIRKVTVEVSYDDGKSWRRTDLRRTGDGWSTKLDAPRGASFATLRTTASDSRGNTVEQRITRAFGLK